MDGLIRAVGDGLAGLIAGTFGAIGEALRGIVAGVQQLLPGPALFILVFVGLAALAWFLAKR
jgi:hypothetical protein